MLVIHLSPVLGCHLVQGVATNESWFGFSAFPHRRIKLSFVRDSLLVESGGRRLILAIALCVSCAGLPLRDQSRRL